MNEKYKIALIYGGKGLEHSVSVKGAEYAYRCIDEELFEPIPVYIKKDGGWLIPKEKATPEELAEGNAAAVPVSLAFGRCVRGLVAEENRTVKIDAAFPLLHGDFGEDGTIAGALGCAGIPYIGCDGVAGAICYDKAATKMIADLLGIPTAKWRLFTVPDAERARKLSEEFLSYPIFIKPSRLGSSFGASRVMDGEDFVHAYETAYRLGDGRVLVEELVDVEAELECGYFGSDCKELFTKVGEIRYSGRFYDYDTKYNDPGGASVSPDALVSPRIKEKIKSCSAVLKEKIGIRGISRFDFFLSKDGRLLFNEINTMPGFTDASLYPKLLEISGISVKEALTELILDSIGAR